jgi:hypothetical protein
MTPESEFNGGTQMRYLSNRLAILLALILMAALVVAPASAQNPGFGCNAPGSNSTVNYTLHQPISQVLPNTCTIPNTTVTLGGEFFFEFHCETKANGDFHEHWTSHYNLTGTDSNGIKYVGKDHQNYDLKMDPDGTFPPVPTSDFRTSDKFKLIAQGPTPDLTMTQKLHVRVDANNSVTVQQDGQPVIKCSK